MCRTVQTVTWFGICSWWAFAGVFIQIVLNVLLLGRSTMAQRAPRTSTVEQKAATGSVLITVSDAEVGPSVFSELKILLDGVAPAANSIRVLLEKKQILITDVPAGESRLVAAHRLVRMDEVRLRVEPGQQTGYSLKLKPAMARLRVICEPGSKVYINRTYYAEVPAAGKTGILEIPPGEVEVECVHDEFHPKAFKGQLAPGDQELELPQERVVFSAEFSDGFGEGTRFWNAPATWQVEGGRLKVAGQGVGLLRDRIYKDFRAQFILALSNRMGAAWLVRTRNESNSYLFQLTGPSGNPPNLFRSFIRQDGNTRLLKSDPVIDAVSRPGSTVEILIEAARGTIKHFIKPSQNPGEAEPLSVLVDKTFSTGTLGFAAVDAEEFYVYFVSILPRN